MQRFIGFNEYIPSKDVKRPTLQSKLRLDMKTVIVGSDDWNNQAHDGDLELKKDTVKCSAPKCKIHYNNFRVKYIDMQQNSVEMQKNIYIY